MTNAKLESLLSEIESVDDRALRAELLLEFCARFKEPPAEVAIRPYAESHRVPACESEAFVWCELRDGLIYPHFAVENPQGVSAKALATILQEALTGSPLETFKQLDEHLIYRIFGRSVSMGRGEGLMGMIRMLRALAAGPQ